MDETITAANVIQNVTLHVRKDFQGKLGNTDEIAFNYYLGGEKNYLDQIREVRYVRNHNAFIEFQDNTYQSSIDRSSNFNFKGYQWGYINDVYVTIILKDGSNSERVLKDIIYDN